MACHSKLSETYILYLNLTRLDLINTVYSLPVIASVLLNIKTCVKSNGVRDGRVRSRHDPVTPRDLVVVVHASLDASQRVASG